MRVLGISLTAVIGGLLLPALAQGGLHKCQRCGCEAACQKVTRIVCEIKKVKVVCWEVKCEDFCAPLPSCPDHCRAACGCDAGCCDGGCQCGQTCGCESSTPCVTPPKCGKVRCRKTLVKKEITKEVPVYKCVVESVCDQCGCGAAEAPEAPAPPALPPPPAPPAPPAPKAAERLAPPVGPALTRANPLQGESLARFKR